jgi:hypothetical protein
LTRFYYLALVNLYASLRRKLGSAVAKQTRHSLQLF